MKVDLHNKALSTLRKLVVTGSRRCFESANTQRLCGARCGVRLRRRVPKGAQGRHRRDSGHVDHCAGDGWIQHPGLRQLKSPPVPQSPLRSPQLRLQRILQMRDSRTEPNSFRLAILMTQPERFLFSSQNNGVKGQNAYGCGLRSCVGRTGGIPGLGGCLSLPTAMNAVDFILKRSFDLCEVWSFQPRPTLRNSKAILRSSAM